MKNLVFTLSLVLVSFMSQASLIVVNSNIDEVVDDADCTLREAISAANLDESYNGCAAGAGYDYILLGGLTDTGILLKSTLNISSGMNITGPGANSLLLKPDANHDGRLFIINTTENVALADFRLVGSRGGAVIATKVNNITLESMLFSGNSGIRSAVRVESNANALTVNNTTFSNNSNDSSGGAIWVNGEVDVEISDSVFINNSADRGGAININSPHDYSFSGKEISISNSQFTQNTSTSGGSAAYISGDMPVHIENSHFSDNENEDYRGVLTLTTYLAAENDINQPFTITSSSFTSNSGSSIYINSKPTEITQSLFFNNEAGDGSIEIIGANALIQNNLIADNLNSGKLVYFSGVFNAEAPLFELDLHQNTFTNNYYSLIRYKGYPDSPIQINMSNNLFNQATLNHNCFYDLGDDYSSIISLGGNVHHGSGDCAPGLDDFPGESIELLPMADYGGVVPSMPLKPDSPWLDQFSCSGDDFSGEGRPRDGDGDGVSLCDLGAVESPDAHKLTINFAGDGAGTVDLFDLDVDCKRSDTTCEWGITQNQTHTLTATPKAGSTFVQWSGACSGNSSCEVTMSAAKNVTAEFITVSNPVRLTTRKFTSAPGLSATIISTPAGIHCGRYCFADFEAGDVVTLTAHLDEGTVVDTWLGCDVISNGGLSCQVSIGSSNMIVDLFLMQDPDIIFKDGFDN